MSSNRKRTVKYDLDLAFDDPNPKKVTKNTNEAIGSAVVAGLFDKFVAKGPNGYPVLFLKGPKSAVILWVSDNYDSGLAEDLEDEL